MAELGRRGFLTGTAAVAAAAAVVPAAVKANAGTPTGSPAALRIPDVAVRKAALDDPTEATLAESAVLLRRGKLSAVELVKAHLDRIDTFESTYQAFVTVLADEALAAAQSADRKHDRGGPLAGIPLCIKDNYFTAGVRTTANSFIFQDFVPPYDATSVARLKGAGAIVIGKGQMGPLATTRATTPNGTITTVNAWTPTDPSVDPGGSSTGPACSVAARLATSSIGTQTGGSIVLPSNQQNLTGLKPTMGRTSIHGVIPLSFTRDHSGPLARDVLDAAIMLTVLAGPDPQDPRTLGLPRLPDLVTSALPVGERGRIRLRRPTRIGVPPDFYTGVPADVVALRHTFIETLSKIKGATIVSLTYPDDWSLMTDTFNNARLSERTEPFRPWMRQDLTLFGVSLLSWLQGLMLSGDEWVTAQRAKDHLLSEVRAAIFGQCDVVLQTGPVPFDILGLPELAFPIGFTTSGTETIPSGTILGAPAYQEDRLVEVAAAYQAVTDWHQRRPADPPAKAAAAARSAAAGTPAAAATTARPRIDAIAAAAGSQ